MKRKNISIKPIFLCFVLLGSFVSTNTVHANDTFYDLNDIILYGSGSSSCSVSGSASGGSVSSLSGSNNDEKVWNYFITKGLTPVAAAGAMGNMNQESPGFKPLVEEGGSGVGFGLIQWSYDRRTNLESAAAKAGVSFASGADEEKALLFQLDYLWDGEYGKQTWQEPVNAEASVDGNPAIDFRADNTGNGSTLVFHKFVERSGDGTKGKQERIDDAKMFLEKFGGGGASSASSNCANTASASSGSIVETAAKWAWDSHVENPNPTDAYRNEVSQYSSVASSNYTDCTFFVGAVMRASVDKNFPEAGTLEQRDYAKSNPDKYQIIDNAKMDQLMPGDLVVTPLGSGGRDGGVANHIAIYGGDNGDGLTHYEASQRSFAPQHSNKSFLTFQFKSSKTIIIRYIGTTQA